MTTYYLYVKTHNKTGMKYLGQTQRNPSTYHGSGTKWREHCEEHGYDLSTEILLETEDFYELRYKGIHYSNLWNVAKSSEWANVYNEYGQGGQCKRCEPESHVGQMNFIKNRMSSTEEKKYDLLQKIFQTHLKILIELQLKQQ